MRSGRIRRGLAGLLALCACLCPAASAASTVDAARPKAEQLAAPGLFQGVDQADALDLDRTPPPAPRPW